MRINKLKTIYKILNDFDSYRSTNDYEKLIEDLSYLLIQIRFIIEISINETFIDILEFVSSDIQYEIDKAVEKRLKNEKN